MNPSLHISTKNLIPWGLFPQDDFPSPMRLTTSRLDPKEFYFLLNHVEMLDNSVRTSGCLKKNNHTPDRTLAQAILLPPALLLRPILRLVHHHSALLPFLLNLLLLKHLP